MFIRGTVQILQKRRHIYKNENSSRSEGDHYFSQTSIAKRLIRKFDSFRLILRVFSAIAITNKFNGTI